MDSQTRIEKELSGIDVRDYDALVRTESALRQRILESEAHIAELKARLQYFIDQKTLFDRKNGNQADAYYLFVKGRDEAWNNARAALALGPWEQHKDSMKLAQSAITALQSLGYVKLGPGEVVVPRKALRRTRDAMSNIETYLSPNLSIRGQKWWDGEKAALSELIAASQPQPKPNP